MTEQERFPREVRQHTRSGDLEIVWKNGPAHRYTFEALRRACKCAECASRKSGPAPAGVSLVSVQPVGSYGLQLEFDDGHGRGIYPWTYLWELGNGALE